MLSEPGHDGARLFALTVASAGTAIRFADAFPTLPGYKARDEQGRETVRPPDAEGGVKGAASQEHQGEPDAGQGADRVTAQGPASRFPGQPHLRAVEEDHERQGSQRDDDAGQGRVGMLGAGQTQDRTCGHDHGQNQEEPADGPHGQTLSALRAPGRGLPAHAPENHEGRGALDEAVEAEAEEGEALVLRSESHGYDALDQVVADREVGEGSGP